MVLRRELYPCTVRSPCRGWAIQWCEQQSELVLHVWPLVAHHFALLEYGSRGVRGCVGGRENIVFTTGRAGVPGCVWSANAADCPMTTAPRVRHASSTVLTVMFGLLLYNKADYLVYHKEWT